MQFIGESNIGGMDKISDKKEKLIRDGDEKKKMEAKSKKKDKITSEIDKKGEILTYKGATLSLQ